MSGPVVFARKEALEILRTWRIWVLPGILLFFALTGPVLARFTPDDLRREPREHRPGQREEQQDAGEDPDAPRAQDLEGLLAGEHHGAAHRRSPPTSSMKTSSSPISPASIRISPRPRAATSAGISRCAAATSVTVTSMAPVDPLPLVDPRATVPAHDRRPISSASSSAPSVTSTTTFWAP